MKDLRRNRMALSTVVTTLIILVVSVLLAGVVSYFAINVTSTRVQEESVHLTKQHVWHDGDSSSQAAFLMINTGGRDLVIDKISVRGQESEWNTVYYNTTTNSLSADLSFNATLSGTSGNISVGGTPYLFTQASTDITVRSGYTILVYITSPDSISVNDIGLTVGMTVHTSQAMYYKECNVEATA
ncbi:MAG: type IV pilin [Candidatus Bathyarchaeota archaeon]|nr:type IV pilin [Candidatus Bathyarchaeota archaeon]